MSSKKKMKRKYFKVNLVTIDVNTVYLDKDTSETTISSSNNNDILFLNNASNEDIDKEINSRLELDKYKVRPFVLTYTYEYK